MDRRSLTLAWIAAAVVLTISAVAVWLVTRETYTDKLSACTSAVRAEVKAGATGLADNRPAGCEEIKSDDYTTIVMDAAAQGTGLYDMLGIE